MQAVANTELPFSVTASQRLGFLSLHLRGWVFCHCISEAGFSVTASQRLGFLSLHLRGWVFCHCISEAGSAWRSWHNVAPKSQAQAIPTKVRFPGAARDFSPSLLSLQALLRCSCNPRVQSHASTFVCTLTTQHSGSHCLHDIEIYSTHC